jgi:dTDP-4-dehydrorhamnose 3,5-epimerase-like enzyme
MYKAKSFPVKHVQDDRGSLIPLEAMKDIPFEVKRVYFIKDVPTNIKRGAHAHYKTNQAIFCIQGSCRMSFDNGKTNSFEKIQTDRFFLIDTMIWHEMDQFSPDCIIVVFADQHFDKADYILNYDEFLRLTK